MSSEKKMVVIIGAGPVGTLMACYLSNRGHTVDIYEGRCDMRLAVGVRGRSINLTLASRGREALEAAGISNEEIDNCGTVEVYGRMVHHKGGDQKRVPYDTNNNHCTLSISRLKLTNLILTAAEKKPGVKIHFQHKLVGCNVKQTKAVFEREDGSQVEVSADIILACDGAHSTMRHHLMKHERLDCSQEYIEHGYMELQIPPTEDNEYPLEKNLLHVWPRSKYTMVALPNKADFGFTVNLFMPFKAFEDVKNESMAIDLFSEHFNDVIQLVGKERLAKDFMGYKPQPLLSVKCSRYHFGQVLLMGDAAHAMVPFYGQGVNSGFEDCLILNELLNKHNDDWDKAMEEYNETRIKDCKAMCDLSMYNYQVLSKSLNSTSFMIRKKLDHFLNRLMPTQWTPLYTMVSFSRKPIHKCVEAHKWQDKVVNNTLSVAAISTIVLGAGIFSQLLSSEYLDHTWEALTHFS